MKWVLAVVGLLFAGLLVAALSVGTWAMGTYNAIVTKGEEVSKAWSQVENVYQRRMDLIPNLVETVKGESGFERGTLTEVAKARASVGQYKIDKSILENPAMFAKFQESQGILGSALSRLMVVQERYPELKANASFQALMAELAGTENRISVERRTFNEAAQDFNTTIKRFPATVFAGYMGVKEKPYFKAEESAKAAPKVSFK